MHWNDLFEPGLEWLKLDGFSAKGVTQGHDTIIEYYWLIHHSKKWRVEPWLSSRDAQHKSIVLIGCRLFFPLFDDCDTEPLIQGFDHIYPTPPLGQDMTQGQFLSGV